MKNTFQEEGNESLSFWTSTPQLWEKKKKSINENINFTFSEKAIEGQILNNMPYMIKTMAWVTKDSMGQWLGNYALCEILSTIKITLDLKNVTNSNFAY